MGFNVMESIAYILSLVLLLSTSSSYVYVGSLVVLLDHATLDLERFHELVSSYGYDPNDYVIESNGLSFIVYKPWYDEFFIIVVGELDVGNETKVFIEVIKIGSMVNGSISSSRHSVYEILYIELGQLIRLGVIKGFSGDLVKDARMYNVSMDKLYGMEGFEERIIYTRVMLRPRWEYMMESGKELYRFVVPLAMGGESTQSPSPIMTETLTTPKQTPSSYYRVFTGSKTSQAMVETIDYTPVLIGFIVAIISSIITYTILRKT